MSTTAQTNQNLPHNTKCFSCGNPSQSEQSRWCEEHWYPFADEDYQELDEGHTRAQAMVISGIMGFEEA